MEDKKRTNWPVTILLILGLITIAFPLYMTVVIAFKQPSEMTNSISGILSLPQHFSLDNFAQEDIKKSIDALKGESTIIIVAHRLSTIRNSDVIYFLDQGKVLDVGTFQELFDRNELFRNMFVAENLT